MVIGKAVLIELVKEIGYFLISKYLRPRLSTDRESGGRKIRSTDLKK